MAVKTRAQLKAENAGDFPDNKSGLISAAKLRGQMDDVVDSAVFPEDGVGGGGGGGGNTVDTGEPYKIILLSNGQVKGVPAATPLPNTPTGLTVVPHISAVSLRWDATPGAKWFYVYRDGVALKDSSGQTGTGYLSYSDTTVVVGNTYSYQVASEDQYGQISVRSAAVSATIDVSLNNAPQDVVITAWPTPLPTDGPAFIRVNAHEIDTQNMAMLLNVDAGALRATDDPSVWIITV